MTVHALSPYAGLEPGTWRSLLARGAVFYSVRTRLVELSEHGDRSVHVEMLLVDLKLCATRISDGDDDDAAVEQLAKAWNSRTVEILALDQLDAATRTLVTELQALSQYACGTDPFHAMFAGIIEHAADLYGEGWRTPILEMAHLGRHPRATPDPYPVTAATPWPPDDATAEVELRIYAEQFGPAAFAALPMLLTHECICHVPARQDRAANDSSFAEGLLDWAAYFFYEMWAVKLDYDLAPAAKWHAKKLRSVLTDADTPEGVARRNGHAAAEVLQAWFQHTSGHSPEEAGLTVARLAVQLNTVDRSLLEKDRFVSSIGHPLPPDLADALRRWADGDLPADDLLGLAV